MTPLGRTAELQRTDRLAEAADLGRAATVSPNR